MRFSTRFFKIFAASIFIAAVFCTSCFAIGPSNGTLLALSESRLNEFSQNNILFYDPEDNGCRNGGGSSSLCGDTTEEKIWSLLLRYFDVLHAAAAAGSIAREGGFQPVKWEYNRIVSTRTCDFMPGVTWEKIYRGDYDGTYGVGSFAITSGLSTYLHYINDTAPDLLEYFKDPSLTCLSNGDALAEKIGVSEVDRLIELEVTYFIEKWITPSKLEAFKEITDLDEAAKYWAHWIEVCAACGWNQGDSEIPIRQSIARGFYEKYADFTCAGSSSYTSINFSSSSSSFSPEKGCISYSGNYPQYYQANYEGSDHENSLEDWSVIPYNKNNVARSGCGPTSMAMLATVATGQDIYPQDVIRITESTGNYVTTGPATLDPLVGNEYGFEVFSDSYSTKTEAYEKIKRYLNEGHMIHLVGHGCHDGFAVPNADGECTNGHYVGLFSINSDDKVWVANSAFMGNSEVDLQSIIDAMHNDGGFTVIKKGGNGGSCPNRYCPGSGSTVISEGGLTFEQAKQFMMYYGANRNGSSSRVVGDLWNNCNGGGSNCVTFSAFFLNKFSNLTYKGGDGDQLVGRLSVKIEYEPRVWSVFSVQPNHTGIILGYHDGEWIVGHASCDNQGIGEGNGGDGTWNGKGTGSGFVIKSPDIGTATGGKRNFQYAYLDVDTSAIQRYLETGE